MKTKRRVVRRPAEGWPKGWYYSGEVDTVNIEALLDPDGFFNRVILGRTDMTKRKECTCISAWGKRPNVRVRLNEHHPDCEAVKPRQEAAPMERPATIEKARMIEDMTEDEQLIHAIGMLAIRMHIADQNEQNAALQRARNGDSADAAIDAFSKARRDLAKAIRELPDHLFLLLKPHQEAAETADTALSTPPAVRTHSDTG